MLTKFRNQKKRRSGDEIFFSALFVFLTLFLIGFLIISNIRITKKRKELEERISALKAEIQTLEEKNKTLEAGISQTGKESYWEEKIREQGYIREGEEPVVILPPEEGKTEKEEGKNSLSSQKLLKESLTNFWDWLKNKIRK